MSLMAIVGGLGSGKTLTATYLGLRNLLKGRTIYANYHLRFEYVPIRKLEDIDMIREGTFLGDELWAWLDARASATKKNKFIAKILLKSRKRGYDIIYTTQDFDQMDKRIRRITDFVAQPQLSKDETWCYLSIADRKTGKIVSRVKFGTALIFKMYDTKEEIGDLENGNSE